MSYYTNDTFQREILVLDDIRKQQYNERKYDYYRAKRSKNFVFLISILIVLAVAFKVFLPFLGVKSELINVIIFADAFLIIISSLYWYLQILPLNISSISYSGHTYAIETQERLESIYEIEKALSIYDRISPTDDTYEEQVSSLVKYISNRISVLPSSRDFSEIDSNFFKNETKRKLFKITLDTIKERLLEKKASETESEKNHSAEDSLKDRTLERMTKLVDMVTTRLRSEIAQQSKRADIYIVFGSGITLIAGAFLYLTVQEILGVYKVNNANTGISGSDMFSIAVRFSIVVFIEVFAFYYLRLYKNIMDNIKYYQNEITNIEMKVLSLHSVENSSCNDSLKIIIGELAKTERNFVIDKNKTTVDLERSKLESDFFKSTTDNIVKLLKSVKS